MAQHWSEGVGTLRYTSREYQQELIDIGCKDNVLTCPPEQAAYFVALKLLQEKAYQIRPPNRKKSIIVTQPRKLKTLDTELRQLTDLRVISFGSHTCSDVYDNDQDGVDTKLINEISKYNPSLSSLSRVKAIESNQVLVVISSVLDEMLTKGELEMSNVNLLVIYECHTIIKDKHLQRVMSVYSKMVRQGINSESLPRIVAFSYPLFTENSPFDQVNGNNISASIAKDYKDFVNNRGEFYNQWDCDDLELSSPVKRVDQMTNSNASTPIRRNHLHSPCLENSPLNSGKNYYSSIHSFVEPIIIEKEINEDYQSMTDFNYWRTDFPIVETLNVERKLERLSMYDKLEYQLEKLEQILYCRADMAPDIVGLKKITGKPREVLLESLNNNSDDYLCKKGKKLKHFMKRTVFNALVFLEDHRYDPTEIYGDDAFCDELRAIPNPVLEPRDLLYQFLHVLEQGGPYAADKAAFVLLLKIEKLKVKIPYERHYLLLCVVFSVLMKIRSAAEIVFEKCESDLEKIKKYTSPKVLRLMDVFKLFKPKMQDNLIQSAADDKNSDETVLINNNGSDEQKTNSKNTVNDTSNVKDKNNSCEFFNNVVIDNETITVFVGDGPKSVSDCRKIETNLSSKDIACDDISSHNITKSNLQIIEFANRNTKQEIINQLDSCDFQSLESKLETHYNKLKDSSVDERTGKVIETVDKILETDDSKPALKCRLINELNDNVNDATGVNASEIVDLSNTSETRLKNNDVNNCLSNPPAVAVNDDVTLNTSTDVKQPLMKDLCRVSPKKRHNENFTGRKGRKGENRFHNCTDPDALCGLVFVDEPLMAKILYSLIYDYSKNDPELHFINAQFTVDKTADPQTEPKEAENEHRLQEEVLRRFRTHDCNLLIGTSVLEDGMDLPKCNLVVRWDPPRGYRCYAQCRSRARAPKSLYALMAPEHPEKLITALAHYSHIERMLVTKCRWSEPGPVEEVRASDFTPLIHPYRPEQQAVTLSQAVQLVNRYCAKLPSDTFTRLVPLWTIEDITYKGHTLYVCSVRLPINSPLKYQVVGHPMPTKVLARRIAALQVCRALHLSGELDSNLLPIGKESFRALEPDWALPASDSVQLNGDPLNEPRPGTTKRKQYYYKKIAKSLTGCRPVIGQPCLAYEIHAYLAVPLPERHNTRGRKLHPPENYAEGFCILTNKPMHQIPVFPLFTRSGEILIELVRMPMEVVMSKRRSKLVHRFMKYTFKHVLRIHNHLMVFNPAKGTKNNYYIVPTTKRTNPDGTSTVLIDWEFLELIYEHTEAVKNEEIGNENQNTNGISQAIGEIELQTVENECGTASNHTNLSENNSAENSVLTETESVSNLIINEEKSKLVEDLKAASPDESVTVDAEGMQVSSKQNTNDENNSTVDETFQNNIDLKTKNIELENNDNCSEGTLVKVEDLSDQVVDNWKGQETKLSSVKWDDFDENSEGCYSKTEKPNALKRNQIRERPEEIPNPYLAPGEVFQFDYEKYRDAVVTPWYRNQNQPQYFYVAEICRHLTPLSAFPSDVCPSFLHYYHSKYGVTITQTDQPLLDVDHTSARLNLLTPRFVNRKGVALPTSSERTKKAKRELLEQKQILVPELCRTHPFRGALWRAAVTLPCVLYRLNSLLLADEIRRSVAVRVSLGVAHLSPDFFWPPLDFGWSLADVLKEKTEIPQQELLSNENTSKDKDPSVPNDSEKKNTSDIECDADEQQDDPEREKTANEIIMEKEGLNESGDMFEVGTWSNDMASAVPSGSDDDLHSRLPGNLTMCTDNADDNIWNSSQKFNSGDAFLRSHHRKYSVADSDTSYVSSDMDMSAGDSNSEDCGDDTDDVTQSGIRIEFKSGNEAEAIEIPSTIEEPIEDQDDFEDKRLEEDASKEEFKQYFYDFDSGENDPGLKQHIEIYQTDIEKNEKDIVTNGTLIKYTDSLSNIKLNDYSENIPFHTPKHDGYRHINRRMDYMVHNLRSNMSRHSEICNNANEIVKQPTNPPLDLAKDNNYTTSLSDSKSQTQLEKSEEDLTNPFPEVYEKALSKNEIIKLYRDMFPYKKPLTDEDIESDVNCLLKGGDIDLDRLEDHKRKILNEIKRSMPESEWRKYNFFAMKDFHNDDTFESDYEDVRLQKKQMNVNCDQSYLDYFVKTNDVEPNRTFSFDFQPDLKVHPGPSPSVILQALTMSNANDGINLERLETVGDSFLKYAITVYLYCSYPNIHEGKLSYLRSKQVSNLNLYRLGRCRHLGGRMVACKFEPHDNWLPPCHKVPPHLEKALIHTHTPSSLWNVADMPSMDKMSREEVEKLVNERIMRQHMKPAALDNLSSQNPCPIHVTQNVQDEKQTFDQSSKYVTFSDERNLNGKIPECQCQNTQNGGQCNHSQGCDSSFEDVPCFVPYNLITQHSIPDKSIADCVEALIGAYLIECGPRGALLFMAWLGITVLPKYEIVLDPNQPFIKVMEEAMVKKSQGKNLNKKRTEVEKVTEEISNKHELTNSIKEFTNGDCVGNDITIDNSDIKTKDNSSFIKNTCSVQNNIIKEESIKRRSKKRKKKNKKFTEDVKKELSDENPIPGKIETEIGISKKHNFKEKDNKHCVGNSIEYTLKDDSVKGQDREAKQTCVREDILLDVDTKECEEGYITDDSVGWNDGDSSGESCDEGSDWSFVDSDVEEAWCKEERAPGSLMPYKNEKGQWVQVIFGELKSPPSPLLRYVPDPDGELMQMLSGYEELERTLNYRFKDRCYLLQAMTHASHTHNRLTDCYQRLEFLGDAVLDYLITRQLYEDPRRHSPGPLTDLRSALVNNTIFASLAVKHGMHKFFRHLSPGLNEVLARFVKIQEENGHSISEEHYLIQEDECEQAEDVEVPKALGDLFESVAGAIFLDSGMSLDTVWRVYYALMHKEMELFSETVPKSPVRELLEMEPETTKFGKPEKLADGRRVRVTVEVLGVGTFKGVGRNFRIAKCTAAKCALRHLNLLRGNTFGAKGKTKK